MVELTKLVAHSLDSVALLDPLVGDPVDPRHPGSDVVLSLSDPGGPSCDGGEDRSGEEGVGHGLHVDLAEALELADRGSGDGRLVLRLDDVAAHLLEHILGESGVTLERGGSDVGHGARRSGDGRDRERVGGARRVRLDVVRRRVGVHPLGDRSEEHTSELQSQHLISYAVFCLKKIS